MTWIWIGVGGAAGALARYVASGWVQGASPSSFPWGTFAVNVVGCFAIGLLAGLLSGPALVRPEVRLGLLVGFLGAFTTFSTYAYETLELGAAGQWAWCLWNVLLANGLGLVAVWAGDRLAAILTRG